jgi:hypothetical protein
MYKADPAWDKPSDPALEERFQRVKAKLMGFSKDPRVTMARYPEASKTVRHATRVLMHGTSPPIRKKLWPRSTAC